MAGRLDRRDFVCALPFIPGSEHRPGMRTTELIRASAAIEAVTGIALIAAPELVARLLLGAELAASGVAVARLAGCGLLALGLTCWPGGDANPAGARALVVYNLLAGLYLGYLRGSGAFTAFLLWPACVLHLMLGVLLVRAAYEGNSPAKGR